MNNKKRKMVLVSILALAGIIFIIGYSVFKESIGMPLAGQGICPRMIPNYFLWLSLILMILVIAPISYYIISKRLEEKMEKNLKAITRLVDRKIKSDSRKENSKTNKANTNSILKLLSPNEKKIVEKILENNGSGLQSEISRMEGMTKLKTHRAIKELERKGIVKVESHGKTNQIILNKDIQDLIS